jgi:hypothetical protein
LVGGLDRNEERLRAIAEAAGHALDTHTGHVEGRGADELRRIVERSDYVVIVTSLNSHGGMWLAKRLSVALKKPSLMLRSCGVGRFAQIVAELG